MIEKPALVATIDLEPGLVQALINDAGTEDAHPLLEQFVQGRLLVTGSDAEGRTLEVAHEALFRSWDRLVH